MNTVETEAVEALRENGKYLRFCIRNPDLTSYDMAHSHLGLPAVNDIWDSLARGATQYVWFVGYLIYVANRVISTDSTYSKVMAEHLKLHTEFLAVYWKTKWSSQFSPEFQKFVALAIGPQHA